MVVERAGGVGREIAPVTTATVADGAAVAGWRTELGRSGTVRQMNPAELRDHCLSFTGAEETFPFGPNTSVFKVAGKMFALSELAADPLRVSLKCEPVLAGALREAHAAVLPGYHLDKRHWNTVVVDGSLSDDAIRDMIEDSYDLVVSNLPRADRRALGWHGDTS
jgi:predicted DNA-binding protein (MmcQ/YjbR family)